MNGLDLFFDSEMEPKQVSLVGYGGELSVNKSINLSAITGNRFNSTLKTATICP